MNYWLMKSEPDTFGFDDLTADPKGYEHWDGVRNFQARNYLRAQRKGDQVFFYHSNCKEPGIVGIAKVVREAYPDHTQFDPTNGHYDPTSKPDDPRWSMTDVAAVRPLKRTITLHELIGCPQLEGFPLIRKGNRLSVLEVSKEHWKFILSLEKRKPPRV